MSAPRTLLCTVPPFATNTPPSGPSALLGYLGANGCPDAGLSDLQLRFPAFPLPYGLVGAAGESFARDVPDLPLALRVLRAFADGRPLAPARDESFDRYCYERTLHPAALHTAFAALDAWLGAWAARVDSELVGFTVWSSNYATTLLAAAHLKRRSRPPVVVAGGPQVTESPVSVELGLRSGLFDAVARGEGEQTLLELVRAQREGRSLRGIAGTSWLEGGEVRTEERPLLKLAELPLPAFERTFLPAYRQRGRLVLPLSLSRGCVGQCAFCSEWGFWQRYRPGPPDRAAEQAQELVARFGADHLQLTDSLMNGHWGRLTGFAEGLLSRGVQVGWSGFLRADMDRPTARLLRRAGLDRVFVGVESLADETLARMNKGLDAAKSFAALEALLAESIQVQVGVIPGFPGDRPELFRGTLSQLLRLQARYPGLSLNVEPFVVSPGQPIFRDLEAFGLRGFGWDEETLALAPDALRPAAARALCRVEGANQGLSRLEQVRIVNALAAAPETAPRLRFEPLDEDVGVFLLRLPESSGAPFLLVDAAERGTLEALAGGEQGWTGSAQLEAIRRAHLSGTGSDGPLAPRESSAGGAVVLSGFVLARVLGDTLWLFDALGHAVLRLPPSLAPALGRLREGTTEAALEPGSERLLVALREAGMLGGLS